jgi:type IV secretory pathway TrbL component
MGAESTGLGKDLNPTNIVDVGFDIFFRAIDQTSVWTPVDSFIGVVLSGIILVILALVALNMLLMLCSAWVLMYGGVFFLGFGGARWTSDIAINYYKAVLGVATSLLIGVGASVLDTYYSQMSKSIDFREMGVILIVCLALLYLVNKVPALLAGIITGAAIGHSGIGTFGTSAAVGSAGVAAAAAAAGGATMMAGAHNISGGAQALIAAVKSAEQHMANGEGMFRGAGSATRGGVGGLAEAMGQGIRFAADVGANLAQGSGTVGKDKIGAAVESFKQVASETIGGQVASAIKTSGEGRTESSGATSKGQDSQNFSSDSLSAGKASSTSTNPEVEAFVNKQAPSA